MELTESSIFVEWWDAISMYISMKKLTLFNSKPSLISIIWSCWMRNANYPRRTWTKISCNSTIFYHNSVTQIAATGPLLLAEINHLNQHDMSLIARFIGPTWCPSGADRTRVGPMLVQWTLLSGVAYLCLIKSPWYGRTLSLSQLQLRFCANPWPWMNNYSPWAYTSSDNNVKIGSI